MLAGQGKEILERLLAELVQYAFYHFANEERVMASTSYPGLAAHTHAHNDLRRNVRAFADRFERGEIAITVELTLFRMAWLEQHFMTTDGLLGEYLNAYKITSPDV
jgi:hemerythrin